MHSAVPRIAMRKRGASERRLPLFSCEQSPETTHANGYSVEGAESVHVRMPSSVGAATANGEAPTCLCVYKCSDSIPWVKGGGWGATVGIARACDGAYADYNRRRRVFALL